METINASKLQIFIFNEKMKISYYELLSLIIYFLPNLYLHLSVVQSQQANKMHFYRGQLDMVE